MYARLILMGVDEHMTVFKIVPFSECQPFLIVKTTGAMEFFISSDEMNHLPFFARPIMDTLIKKVGDLETQQFDFHLLVESIKEEKGNTI